MRRLFIQSSLLIFLARIALSQDAVAPSPSPDPHAEAERIVVATTPLGGELSEQVQPVTILSGDALELRLEPTIGDTLNREPGVSSTSFGPGASRPVIRGLSEDRIGVLQDGLSMTDASTVSPDHAVTIEPLTIKIIEVVRGPATLLYGPNTVGGVVNAIDNRIPSELLQRPITGKAEGRFGSVDDQRAGAGIVEFGLGPIVVHLDGFKRETDDIDIPGFARSERLREIDPLPPGETEAKDVLPNSFTESEGGAAGTSYVWDKGYVGVSYSVIDSTYGTVAEPDVTIGLEQRRWDTRGAIRQPFAPIKSITYKFGYSDYNHTEFEGSEVGTVFDSEGYDGRLEIAHEKLGLFEGVFGYQTQETDFSALGEEAFLPVIESQSHAGFIFEEIALDPVRLQFGLRFDHVSHERDPSLNFGPGLTRDFDAISGSSGIVYTPNEEYVIALSLAYTQRPPTYVELFANGPHLATNAFEIGNPELDLEQSIGLDLSLRRKTGRITGAVSFFYNHFIDFIREAPTGEIEDDLPVFQFAATDADFVGGEIVLDFHLIEQFGPLEPTSGKDGKSVATAGRPGNPHRLHLETKADYVYAQDLNTDRSLPRITPFRTSAALIYGWKDCFEARLEGQYVHEQDRTAEFELPTDSYFLLSTAASYRLPVGPTEVEVFVKGTNLTNEEARMHTSFLKDIAPLAGRGVLGGLRVTF